VGPTSKGKEGRVGREQEGEGTYTSIGDEREEKEGKTEKRESNYPHSQVE